jgi:site-specific DNA recombinase
VLDDNQWFEQVYAATIARWKTLAATSPGGRSEIERQLASCTKKIEGTLRLIDSVDDVSETLTSRLNELTREQRELEQKLAEIDARGSGCADEPTREYVRSRLTRLHETLRGDTEQANQALRGLFDGPIIVGRASMNDRKRDFWRGILKIKFSQVIRLVIPELSAVDGQSESDDISHEVTLDFYSPLKSDNQTAEVWRLLQQGLPQKEIAEQMSLTSARVSTLMKHVAAIYGEGRTPAELREIYCRTDRGPRAHVQYIDRAMELFLQGMLMGDIAKRLGTHGNMITAAIQDGYKALGLPVPDGRSRRKLLEYKGHVPNACRGNAGSGPTTPQADAPSTSAALAR